MTNLSNVIQETSEYDKIKILKGNRKQKESLILDIMDSFGAKPQLRVARPLLLNQKMELIDGQHRLEASKRMKLPVFYMIVKDLTIEDARLLNALQKTWTVMDYCLSYAETGHKDYQRLLEIHKEYGVTINMLLTYFSSVETPARRRAFKLGDFEIEDEEAGIARLNQLMEFSNYIPHWNQDSMSGAFLRLSKMENYDHERMMKKLEQSGGMIHRGSAQDYLRDLEVIYNKNVPIGRQVRFV